MKKHLLIDIETLGTMPGCIILEIGAVAFDESAGDDWETWQSGIISLDSSMDEDLKVDADTLRWWTCQEHYPVMVKGTVPLRMALGAFLAFAEAHLEPGGTLWCWGASFDFPLLKEALGRCCMTPAWWHHWNERDARTLCGAMGVKREGKTAHRALADAAAETVAVCRALAQIKAMTNLQPTTP
jgi:hypothetical protein